MTMPSPSVNITSVSKSMKICGELITVQKDTQKSIVTVLSKHSNPAQVNGIVTILNGLPLLIWITMIKTVMVKSTLTMVYLMTTWKP